MHATVDARLQAVRHEASGRRLTCQGRRTWSSPSLQLKHRGSLIRFLRMGMESTGRLSNCMLSLVSL